MTASSLINFNVKTFPGTSRIIKCNDCGYNAIVSHEEKVCRKCGGKLETIAREGKRNG